jgi:hypothetical protein
VIPPGHKRLGFEVRAGVTGVAGTCRGLVHLIRTFSASSVSISRMGEPARWIRNLICPGGAFGGLRAIVPLGPRRPRIGRLVCPARRRAQQATAIRNEAGIRRNRYLLLMTTDLMHCNPVWAEEYPEWLRSGVATGGSAVPHDRSLRRSLNPILRGTRSVSPWLAAAHEKRSSPTPLLNSAPGW